MKQHLSWGEIAIRQTFASKFPFEMSPHDVNTSLDHEHSDHAESVAKDELVIPLKIDVDSTPKTIFVFSMVAIGVLGNIITMVKILTDRKLHKPTYFAILFMAIADCLFLLYYLVHVLLLFSRITHSEELFMTLYFIFTHLSAAHMVKFLGVRFYITVYPFKARDLSIQRLLGSSIFLWILSAVFGIMYYILRFKVNLSQSGIFILVLTMRLYLLIVPVTVIIIFHYKKTKALAQSLRLQPRRQTTSARMTLMTVFIIGVYMSSAVLYPICFVLENKKYCHGDEECERLLVSARYMWLINVSINPIIYFLFSPPIYKYLKRSFSVEKVNDLMSMIYLPLLR